MSKLIAGLGLNRFGVKLFLAYFAILGLGIYLLLNTLLGKLNRVCDRQWKLHW
ncbi:hypothetical protein [Aliamphritea spongicola]|nr:hypothetical protein [Aliamphritea spongicola]